MSNNSMEEDHSHVETPCSTRMGKSLINGAMLGGLGGVAALAWYPDPYTFTHKGVVAPANLGLRYVFNGLRPFVGMGAVSCAVYSAVECLFEGMRDEDRSSTFVNSAAGGAAAGIVVASVFRRFDVMATSAIGVGMLSGYLEYSLSCARAQKTKQIMSRAAETSKTKPAVTEASLKAKYPEFRNL